MSTANLGKKFFLLCVGICRVNESDLLGRYSPLNEFISDVIINIEAAVILRCGKVAEHKLCRLFIRILFPNLVDVLNASVDLTSIIISKTNIDKSLIKCSLSSVVCDEKHIVLC